MDGLMDVFLLVMAGLLFVFGLIWPGRLMWLKWLTGATAVLGTLFVGMVLALLISLGRSPVVDGKPVEQAHLAAAMVLVALIFWLPALGLWVGRKAGRLSRSLMASVQETNL